MSSPGGRLALRRPSARGSFSAGSSALASATFWAGLSSALAVDFWDSGDSAGGVEDAPQATRENVKTALSAVRTVLFMLRDTPLGRGRPEDAPWSHYERSAVRDEKGSFMK